MVQEQHRAHAACMTPRRVCCTQCLLYLGRGNLPTVLVKWQHHSEAVPQGEVIPGEVKPPFRSCWARLRRCASRFSFRPCLYLCSCRGRGYTLVCLAWKCELVLLHPA